MRAQRNDKLDERDLRLRRTPRMEQVRGIARSRKSVRQIEIERDDLDDRFIDQLALASRTDA